MSEKREISDEKRKYLESIGIDIDNLPDGFEQICTSIDQEYSPDMQSFAKSYAAEVSIKRFRLEDIIGTAHPDYYNKSWIDFFLATKRGDNIVKKFNGNPEYYSEFLKQPNQDNSVVHDTMLELYENDGKFIIKGGNNRIAFIMMQYLKEMSEAKSDEEKQAVNEKYTFYGEVRTLPRDKDFIPLVLYLGDKFDYRVRYGGKDGQYRCEKNGKTLILSSKEEMVDFIRENIFGEISDSTQIMRAIQDFSTQPKLPPNVKNEIIPNYVEIIRTYRSLSKDIDERKLLEGYNYQKDGLDGLQRILENEKDRIEQEKREQAQKESEEREKVRRYDEEEEKEMLEALKKSSKRRAEFRRELLKQSTSQAHFGMGTMQNGETTKSIEAGKSIPRALANDFVKMNKAQIQFMSVAAKLGIDSSTVQMMDTRQYIQSINQLGREMDMAAQIIMNIDDAAKISEVETRLAWIQAILESGDVPQEFSREIQSRFIMEFGKKVDSVIRTDKLSRLQMEYEDESKKKFGLIGRITGKKRLHDEKIKNIALKQKMIQLEYEEKEPSQTMEDSISDLYSYIYKTYNKEIPPHLLEFVDVIDLDENIQTLFDKKKMQEIFQKKIKTNRESELPIEARKVSTKEQTASLMRQNMELGDEISGMTQQRKANLFKQSIAQDRCYCMEKFNHRLKVVQSLITYISGRNEQIKSNEDISVDK